MAAGPVRLVERMAGRWSARYYEGEMSGAAVLLTGGADDRREASVGNLVAAARQAYGSNGVVFACILARMMLLAEATFKFRTLVDKKLFGTEDLRILEYPWPNGVTGDLVARVEQDASLAGNAYFWKADDDLLVRLPPDLVTIVSTPQVAPGGGVYKQVIGYDYDPNPASAGGAPSAEAQFFTVDEVAHFAPIPDHQAKVRGMSWLTPILAEVGVDSAMTGFKAKYMDHGTPISAVRYAQKLRPDTQDAVQERIMAKFGGVSNAWRPFVFDQGADPVMGTALKDLDFRAVQAGGETRICAAAGVPPVVVGLRNAEPAESYQAAMRRFADLTCRPLWRNMCASLQKFVPNMPPKGVQLWYDTSDIAALQAAETEKAQVTQVSAAAVLTFVQAGYKRDSVISAVTSGDLGLLVPDPNAPTPGVVERETITGASPFDTAGQPDDSTTTSASATGGRAPVTGVPPGGGQTLTKPQTAASKKPQPASILEDKLLAPNGKGRP